jgi:hypothetical protein
MREKILALKADLGADLQAYIDRFLTYLDKLG